MIVMVGKNSKKEIKAMSLKKKSITLMLLVTMIVSSTGIAVYADSNSSYNRSLAAQYAAEWVNGYNLAQYYDAGVDCTNFASQCLKAGGMSMTGYGGNYGNYNNWYAGTGGGSAAWESAHSFRYHWGNVNGTGRKRGYRMTTITSGEIKPYNNATADAKFTNSVYNVVKPGDIIQYYNPSSNTTTHSQVVHRTSVESGELKVSMAQHTDNGWKNFRAYVRGNVSDNVIICIIKIKND